MNQPSLLMDEDQDSLFGSPPPSPGRGRSPSQEVPIAGEEVGPLTTVPSAGVGRKNVGTIALPGSHMSCAELPADLSASSASLPRSTSSRDSSSVAQISVSVTPTSAHTPSAAFSSSTRPVPSRASSAASSIPSAAASTKKRRTPKAKSLTPAPPAPPITLPGPDEPTPPNFLRSQSSLLGLAGVVGCVKPTQLYTHPSKPTSVQQSCSPFPAHGSTPTHPIVLDDDQDTPQFGNAPPGQLQMPPRMDRLNPEALRSNILSSLSKEKNIFPVLESLVKLLGGEPLHPSPNPPPQPFAQPYNHGIFNVPSSSPVVPPSTSGSATPVAPPPKRRKLKHVPAGAADWDVPFPFAVGEGPEAYHDSWARDRARQLVVQLLELVRDATKRAAIKTAKSEGKGQIKMQSRQSSRSMSVETQIREVNSTESTLPVSTIPDSTVTETPSNAMSMDTLYHFLGSLGSPSMDGLSAFDLGDSAPFVEGVTEEGSSATSLDHLGFEEWLSQLQNLLPFETDTCTSEPSDCGTHLLAPLDFLTSGLAPSTPVPAQPAASIVPRPIQDHSIDPTLLAISQQVASPPQSQLAASPTSALVPGSIPQALEISSILPVLSHTPRTSFSSVAAPPTPPPEVFGDALASMITDGDLVHESHTHEPVEKDHHAHLAPSPSPADFFEPPRIFAAQKGKARVDVDVTSTPSISSRSTPNSTTSKGALDKQAILERARERRKQLVAEIERAKLEMWELSVESAVFVHLARDRPDQPST